jgi:GNAT superfamily N-acetyltransferase
VRSSESSDRADALDVIVERLDRARHDCSRFSCGKPPLDNYLRETVERDQDEHTAVAYVMVDESEPTEFRRVVGYFTLNSFSFLKKQARRRDQDRNLGRYNPVAAVLIGRLALDQAFQGKGLGSVLIVSALTHVLALSEQLGIAVVVVHAIDDEAASFYEHQGFVRFRDEPNHLYYPLVTVASALASIS